MKIKIQKVDLSVTNNGTAKAIVFAEGTDINNQSEAIEIIGDEVIYLATRKQGEEVEFVQKGKWLNVVLPEDFAKALNSSAYDRVKLLFKRGVAGVNKATNGSRSQIDLNTAKVLISDNLDIQLKIQNFVIETLSSLDTPFSKQVLKDLKSKDSNEVYNAWKVINELTVKNMIDVSKEYMIVNDCEEVKIKK